MKIMNLRKLNKFYFWIISIRAYMQNWWSNYSISFQIIHNELFLGSYLG
jgi:hypothetical protein